MGFTFILYLYLTVVDCGFLIVDYQNHKHKPKATNLGSSTNGVSEINSNTGSSGLINKSII